jgi:hypothetical protein
VLDSRSMSVGLQRTFKAFVGQSHVHKSTRARNHNSSQRAANKFTGPEDSPNATTFLIPSKIIQRLAGNPEEGQTVDDRCAKINDLDQ